MGCISPQQKKHQPRRKGQQTIEDWHKQNPFAQSKIVGTFLQETKLLKCILAHICKQKVKFKLVFRASENGYDAKKFHEKCHGIKSTLLLAVTEQEMVFGGYTPCTWLDNQFYKYEADQNVKSCLFRVDDDKEMFYKLKKSQKDKAIMNHKLEGPIFGEGHDLMIKNECNKNQCWSNLGQSYQCCHKFSSSKANKQLASKNRFFIQQYEIWQIQV